MDKNNNNKKILLYKHFVFVFRYLLPLTKKISIVIQHIKNNHLLEAKIISLHCSKLKIIYYNIILLQG